MVEVHSADIMGSLIDLKEDVEEETGIDLRLVFSGASEAHLLAKEIGRAGVGVILNPSRPFPIEWRSRRMCVVCISACSPFSLQACKADTSAQIAWKTAYGKERTVALDGTRSGGWIRSAREMDG